MVRKYTPRNRDKLIEQRNQNSLTHLLKNTELTEEEKRKLITQSNPLLYIFGENLTVVDYQAQYMNEVQAQLNEANQQTQREYYEQ